MFEYIGLLTYLYTRLDALSGLMQTGAVVGGLMAVFAWAVYSIAYPSYSIERKQEEYETAYKPICLKTIKAGIILFIACMVLRVAIPTKDDALLIGGVVIGANVAEKTINAVSESEMIGKVFEIVEAKVDQTLNDIKGKPNEIPQGQNNPNKK